MTISDKDLLKKAQQLDPEALRLLHQKCYEPVTRYIQFKVGDHQTVQDLSGEVFVRAIEGLKRGNGWQDSPQSWLMGIARYTVADYYRKQEKIKEVILNEQITSSSMADPDQFALKNERLATLRAAIDQLTPEQREVILMRFIEGLDIKTVAAALDKTSGAVKGLQFRALRSLAEIMDPRSVGAEQ